VVKIAILGIAAHPVLTSADIMVVWFKSSRILLRYFEFLEPS
jgi:hypothetical protein